MSFAQFIAVYGMLWSAKEKQYLHWNLWPKQRELAVIFGKYQIPWVLKARQLGISEMMAMYGFYVAVREPRSEIIIISKKLPDAKYFLKKRVLTKLESSYDKWGDEIKPFWPKYTPFEGKIEFDNGSWIEAASSDNQEIRSHTPRLILFDEIATYAMTDASELWSAMRPAIADQERGQMLCVSTAKSGTWFNKMSKMIINKEIVGPEYFFMPGSAHPRRDEAWYAKERGKWANHKLFYREYPRTEDDCFVSNEGNIWPQFDTRIGGRHVRRFEIDFRMKFCIVYDHGRQHPAAMMFALYDRHTDHLYIFDELFMKGLEITEVAYQIREKLNFYKKHLNAPKPQLSIADTACFAKDGRRPVADTLRTITGIHFKKSIKHDQKGAIDLVGARMSTGGLTIDPRCKNTIRQISEWIYKYDPEQPGHKEEKPIDIDDDLCDCGLYLVSELHASPRSTTFSENTRFNPTFNVHRKNLRRSLLEDDETVLTTADFSPDELEAWQGL